METTKNGIYWVNVVEAPVSVYAVTGENERELVATFNEPGTHSFPAMSSQTEFEGGRVGVITGPFDSTRTLDGKGAAGERGEAGSVTVDQTYTPTSTAPQSGTAVSEGLAFTNFRATLFQYPYCVATWSQFEEMNPHYLTDKIVFLPGLLAEPSSLTLPNAEYVMHKWPGGFAANSGPSQFPGGQLTTIIAPNAKCIWVQPVSVNSQVKFSNYYAKRVVFYCASDFGFGVANGGFSWESYRFEGYDTKSMVCELVMPYQTSEVALACPAVRGVANFPREWRIFLPSIRTGVKLFTETGNPNFAVPPVSKESILYLLNHVRKAVFGSGGPYVFSLALAADYFDENGELIDEELKAKVTEMAANYTISFVKSNYYL